VPIIQAVASDQQVLSEKFVADTLAAGLGGKYTGANILVLIPDHTRTLPLPMLFRQLVTILADAKRLDFLVALGTHPLLSETFLCQLVGITPDERQTTYQKIGLFNHAWDDPAALTTLGILSQDQIREIAGDAWHPSLGGDVPIRINRRILDYDQIIILGPTFPHEVVGFSGGAKYLFPGISGAEMINVTHWLAALITCMEIIGIKDTPIRQIIHTAAACVPTPITLVSMVVVKEGMAGIFIGDHLSAWEASVGVSARRHILWVDQPYQQVLSCAPPMYDELWTASKAMYKLEPAIADGGELILYAPHLDTVSHVHGEYLYEVGYHVRDYFLKQWERFSHVPAGVLAHSSHLRGAGIFEDGIEHARIQVTLATKITPQDCERLALGYRNPDGISLDEWQSNTDPHRLWVPKAGEMLYRLRS
jgi:nickel-dependent lactate racemase